MSCPRQDKNKSGRPSSRASFEKARPSDHTNKGQEKADPKGQKFRKMGIEEIEIRGTDSNRGKADTDDCADLPN
jgi:hypothetical protein